MNLTLDIILQWLFERMLFDVPNYFFILLLIAVLIVGIVAKKRSNWSLDDNNRRQGSRRAEDNYPNEKELSKLDETVPAQKFRPKK